MSSSAPDPRGADSGPVQGDTTAQSSALEELRAAHNYRAWLVSLAEPFLGDDPLEIGSGLGDYALEWSRPGRRVTATEADPRRLADLRARFRDTPGVVVEELAVPVDRTSTHSAVVALNVLEHIPDDVSALRAFAGLVRPGGAVVLAVPAFPLLMSRFDLRIGHQRRYRRAGLRRGLEAAGLRVERLHHLNVAGWFAWLLMVRLLGRAPSEGLLLSAFDRGVLPVQRRIEQRFPPPFGQSLFAVARVPQT